MIANHTSMAQLFRHTVTQYDKLKKRNAFLDVYRKEPMFANGFEEFDSARYISSIYVIYSFAIYILDIVRMYKLHQYNIRTIYNKYTLTYMLIQRGSRRFNIRIQSSRISRLCNMG